MAFHTIDLSTWNRAEHFLHYKNEVQCAICITHRISITRLVPFLKQKKLRFYPVMIYLVTKALHLISSRDGSGRKCGLLGQY